MAEADELWVSGDDSFLDGELSHDLSWCDLRVESDGTSTSVRLPSRFIDTKKPEAASLGELIARTIRVAASAEREVDLGLWPAIFLVVQTHLEDTGEGRLSDQAVVQVWPLHLVDQSEWLVGVQPEGPEGLSYQYAVERDGSLVLGGLAHHPTHDR